MNYSEVKKELKKEFEIFLKPFGFKSKSGSQGCEFINITASGSLKVGYGVANYIDEFNTGIFISIHIRNIGLLMCHILNEKYEENAGGVISGSTADYFNELNYRYKIKTQEDIIEWGKIVQKFYEEYAVPFFEKYNSVEAIDKLLNDNPTEKVIYLDDLGWRIITGLIVAKLNQNPKYNELRDYYKSEVESKFQGYFMYEKCMNTIDFLDSHSQVELLKISETT